MADKVVWDSYQETLCDYLGMEKDEITPETDIYSDLGLDSLGVVSVGLKLKGVYGITVPLSAVSSITTIGGMFDVMNEYA